MKKIFAVLDIKTIATVDKVRKIYTYQDFEVAIDAVKDELQREIKRAQENIPGLIDLGSPRKAEQGLAKLVLTLVELIRKLMEKEAFRRVKKGTLSSVEIQKLGLSLKAVKLKIKELAARIKKHAPKQVEIILAFNPNIEGDATALYLERILKPLNAKITRLARGLSTGGDLEYTDEATLINALKNRR